MAQYLFSMTIIGRSKGRNVIAAAAYRAGCRLHDDRLDRNHDFTSKPGVVHSEILLPEGSPDRWLDREVLWNEADRMEKCTNSQLARDFLLILPRELSQADAIELARGFIQSEFIAKGMVADLNVHWDPGVGGQGNPHAHILTTTRNIEGGAFALKNRSWDSRALLIHWREAWADHVNKSLAERGFDRRVDHRSLVEQGIDLEPMKPLLLREARQAPVGRTSRRAAENHAIAQRNGERIIGDPSVVLKAMTQQQSTFTREDLSRLVFRYTDGKAQFDRAMSTVMLSRELVPLGQDGKGQDRFTSREMLKTERDMVHRAKAMAGRHGHAVTQGPVQAVMRDCKSDGLILSIEQKAALAHVTSAGDLALVIGYAGSGKSTMLGRAREIWTREGYNVRGATLSGVAAESLEQGTAIASRTIASLEHAWARNRDRLGQKDILVIDEAGLIGSRQMQRVLHEAERAGAKVVMVGDPEQLQAIEAGAAFRALTERHGAVEITQVQRQREDWQRQATRELATGRTDQALARYGRAGDVRAYERRADAQQALVVDWLESQQQHPSASQMMLAATREDAGNLNRIARTQLKAMGRLTGERTVATDQGPLSLAVGERILFLRNDTGMGVKNGTFATLEHVRHSQLSLRLDDGRTLQVDPRSYASFTHGYAATIHKAQGLTLDRVQVLAGPTIDAHSTYVALTRHRQSVTLHYGRDDFAGPRALVHGLSRQRTKDVTLDYGLERRARSADHYRSASTWRHHISRLDQGSPQMPSREHER